MLRGLGNRMSSKWFSSWPSWFIRGRTVLIFAMTGKWRLDLELKTLIAWRWKLIFYPHGFVFNRNLWHFPRFPMFLCWKVEHQPTQRPIGCFKAKPRRDAAWFKRFWRWSMTHRIVVDESWWMSISSLRNYQNSGKKTTANRPCSGFASGTLLLHLFCSIFLRPVNQGWRQFFLLKTISI